MIYVIRMRVTCSKLRRFGVVRYVAIIHVLVKTNGQRNQSGQT